MTGQEPSGESDSRFRTPVTGAVGAAIVIVLDTLRDRLELPRDKRIATHARNDADLAGQIHEEEEIEEELLDENVSID